MGTSKNYKAKVKGEPQWGDLSGAVTRACDGSDIEDEDAQSIMDLYYKVTTGGENVVTDPNNHKPFQPEEDVGSERTGNFVGGGGAGRSNTNEDDRTRTRTRSGRTRSVGKAGRRTATRLGGFLGTVVSSGLYKAFSEIGLDISGKTVREAVNYLLEYCTGVATNLDETAAKAASNQLIDELTEGSTTLEEMDSKLQQVVNNRGIDDIIINYFALYSYEHLYQMFYGKLVKEKGRSNCSTLFNNIKEFILEYLKGMNQDKPLRNVNWKSNEAQGIIDEIYTKTLNGFLYYED